MPKNPQRFGGLLTNVDLKDVPPGMMVTQTNIGNYRPGRLDVRKGCGYLKTPWVLTPSGSADSLASFGFVAPQARWFVTEKSDGTIKAHRNTASQEIVTGLNVFQPMCCMVDLYGSLVIVNGIERGYRWNGVASAPDSLGVDSPIDLLGAGGPGTPLVDVSYLPGTGNVNNDTLYYLAYRHVDRDGIPSSISEIYTYRTEVGASGTAIKWTDGTGPSGEQIKISTQARVATGGTMELWRSTGNAPGILYRVTSFLESAWSGMGSVYIDNVSDQTLFDSDPDNVLPMFDPDGFPNARRFEKPPTNKPFVALHQDIALYYGRVFYTEGTLAATATSATVTGTSTAVRSEMVSWKLRFDGETVEYTVATVNEGAQTFTITPVYAGSTGSGKSYTLSPDAHDEAYTLRFSVKGEPESVPSVYAHRVQSSSASSDLETGIFPFGAYCYLFHETTFYQVSYGTNPALDISVSPAHYRGLVNQNCVIAAESAIWAMDQLGCYKITGGGIEDISSGMLRNYFDETIDWTASKRKWYFASYQPHARVLRWHVQFVGDGDTRPSRAVCYNVTTGEWWDEQYPMELGGAAIAQVSGKDRLICGGENDNQILMGEGYADLIAASVQGTITTAAAATTSFIDSAATFGTDVVGCPVSIISGTGKGTTRTISTRTNGTTLVVDSAWTVDTTSVYIIGAISWNLKTGGYEYLTPTQEGRTAAVNVNRCLKLQHIPTSNYNVITLALYQNRSATKTARSMLTNDATGFTQYKEDGDIEILTINSRGYGSTDPGFTHVDMDNMVADSASADRFVQVAANGYQGPEQITLPALDMIGFG